MRDKRLRKLFREQESGFDMDKWQERLPDIETAIWEKQIGHRPGKADIFWTQLCYIEKSYWMAQFLILTFTVTIFALYNGGNNMWLDLKTMLAFISCVAAFAGMGGVLGLNRMFSYHMEELMSTFYFNIGQMASMRLVIYSAVDLLFLTVVIAGVTMGTRMSALIAAVYLLVPFLLSNLCYFTVFSLVKGKVKGAAFAAASVFSSIIGISVSGIPACYIYDKIMTIGAALFIAMMMLLAEIKYVLRNGGDHAYIGT